MASDLSASNTCRCGNPGALHCEECRASVCRLCVRKGDDGAELCLACRSGAIERAEDRASAKGSGRFRLEASSARLKKAVPVRRQLVLLPFLVVSALAAMAAFVIPLFAEARGARAEHKAENALRAIHAAQQEASLRGTRDFLTLEELRERHLIGAADVPLYELRVELARDRKKFWARAIPLQQGLRRFYVDGRGDVTPEGE